jgi:hypothetical protein
MSTVDHLLAMASECRDLATLAKTEEVREHLLEVSDQIERVVEYRLQVAREQGAFAIAREAL